MGEQKNAIYSFLYKSFVFIDVILYNIDEAIQYKGMVNFLYKGS